MPSTSPGITGGGRTPTPAATGSAAPPVVSELAKGRAPLPGTQERQKLVPTGPVLSLDESLQQRRVPTAGAASPVKPIGVDPLPLKEQAGDIEVVPGDLPTAEEGGSYTTQSLVSEEPSLIVDGDTEVQDIDLSNLSPGEELGPLVPDADYEQVGDDLYVDLDGDGTVDVIAAGVHVNEDGQVVVGPPPDVATEVTDVGPPPDVATEVTDVGPQEGPPDGAEPSLIVDDDTVTLGDVNLPGAPPSVSLLDIVAELGPNSSYEQVGDDVYIDVDGDGTADVIWPNTRVEDGMWVTGPPPEAATEVAATGPQEGSPDPEATEELAGDTIDNGTPADGPPPTDVADGDSLPEGAEELAGDADGQGVDGQPKNFVHGLPDGIVLNSFLEEQYTQVDADNGEIIVGPPPNYTPGDQVVQVGDDVYITHQNSTDGAVDVVVRGAHVNEDGQIVSGPPPTDVADGSPAQDADGGNAIDPVSADNNNGLTPEELAGYIDEHPDSAIQDYDGDGDYEAGVPIDEGAAVIIEDGYVYVDTDGDGSADIVAAAEYYDPEANAIYVPVDPNDLNIHGDSGLINPSYGYISEDRDGDGVAEKYLAVDFDWDGVADYVDYERGEVFSDVIIRELDYVEASGDGSDDFPGGTEELAGVTTDPVPVDNSLPNGEEPSLVVNDDTAAARLKLFGGGGAVLAQSAPAALPADDVAQALTDLKSLYDKGLLPDSQYEIMQGQALAALDLQATGVEGGLRLLRNFWDQGLISADPYAAKRQEYLDAL